MTENSPSAAGPCFIWRSIGIVGRHRTQPAWKSLKRTSDNQNVGSDTLYACLKCLGAPHAMLHSRMSQCPADPSPSSGFVHCSGTHCYLGNVAAAINNRSLDFPFRECLFFISSGCKVATTARARIHSASPDHSSLFMLVTAASISSRGSDARQRWSQKNTSSPKGFKHVHVQGAFRRKGHVELADKPTERPGACTSVVRGHGLVLNREMARIQRNTSKGRE